MKKVPVRYAPILFGAILSGIMVTLVSAFVIAVTQGFHAGFLDHWVKSFVMTWPVAFVAVTLIAPWVRKLVDRITG